MNAYKRMLLAGFCAGSTILAFGSQAQAAKAASPKVDKTSAAIAAYADELVIPTYKTMSDNALKFAKAAKELKAAPTDAKVAEAGKLLLETRVPWELSDSWPLDTTNLDAVAKNADSKSVTIDAAYVRNSLGAETRGFHAAEYLLFRDGQPRKAADLTPGQLSYLAAVAEVIAEDSITLEAWWAGSDKISEEKAKILEEAEIEPGKSYAGEFKKAGQAGSRYESNSEVLDEIIDGSKDIIDEIADSKVGKPYETADAADCESLYSYTSLVDSRHNVQSVEKSYNVISPLVAAKSAKVDQAVKGSIAKVFKSLDAIQGPLVKNLDKKEQLKAIIDSCKELSENLDKVQELLVK